MWCSEEQVWHSSKQDRVMWCSEEQVWHSSKQGRVMWCSEEQVWHSSKQLFTERFPVDINISL